MHYGHYSKIGNWQLSFTLQYNKTHRIVLYTDRLNMYLFLVCVTNVFYKLLIDSHLASPTILTFLGKGVIPYPCGYRICRFILLQTINLFTMENYGVWYLFIYLQDEPERTASAFHGDYYLSGDRAFRDEDGYLWFVSRSDDVIISAG